MLLVIFIKERDVLKCGSYGAIKLCEHPVSSRIMKKVEVDGKQFELQAGKNNCLFVVRLLHAKVTVEVYDGVVWRCTGRVLDLGLMGHGFDSRYRLQLGVRTGMSSHPDGR